MTHATRTTLGGALLLAAAATAGIATAAAQDAPAPAPAEEPAQPPAAPAPADRHADLVKQLGDADFQTRTRAYEELKAAGKDALPALKEGSRSKDAQVQWASRRLLGLIGAPERDPAPGRRPVVLRFGEERRADDEDAPLETQMPELRIVDEEAVRRSMEEMRRRMEEMQKDWAERARAMAEQGHQLANRLFEDPGTAKSEMHVVVQNDGERTEFRREAGGRVKVTLTRRGEDGQEKTENYEAESLDALAKEHPEIHARVRPLAGGGFLVTPGMRNLEIRMPEFRWDSGTVENWGRVPQLWRDSLGRAKPVLGVSLSAVPPVLRTQCAIPEDEGVVVESVGEDSLAARMSMQKHDVILAVNGVPVSSATEVRAAVEAVKEGAEVRAKVLRAGKTLELAGTR